MSEFCGRSFPPELLQWAHSNGFPQDTLHKLENTVVPAEAVPFFDWILSECAAPENPCESSVCAYCIEDQLECVKSQSTLVAAKLAAVECQTKRLMEKPVRESLHEEIEDLRSCIAGLSKESFESRKGSTRGAMQLLLRQEALLTRTLCEMEEDMSDGMDGNKLAISIDISDQLDEFKRIQQLSCSFERLTHSSQVAAAKSEALVRFRDQLARELGNVQIFTADQHSDLSVTRNELARLRKKVIDMENDRMKSELLQEKAKLEQSSACGAKLSASVRQRKAAEAMHSQSARYNRAIDIMKKELKRALTVKLKCAQCFEFVEVLVRG